MADPLSIAAIIALVFAGKKLSETSSPVKVIPIKLDSDTRTTVMNSMNGNFSSDPGLSSFNAPRREKFEQPSFGIIAQDANRQVFGSPAVDFRDRPWISGLMNNFAPSEKIQVGPGLGVDANVAAIGGFQQVYRVLPNNVGAYRLTTLPGRPGPVGDITGGARTAVGILAHNRPEKTAFLPERRGPLPSRGQGQGGELNATTGRESYEKTKRPTNRSETGLRSDNLNTAPAKRFTTALTLAQDPTRNKGDLNDYQFGHVNNPSPGIHSFVGAYGTTVNDIRPADKRGNLDRMGNAGRMNVRANPTATTGKLTQVRAESEQQPIAAKNAGWTQQYMPLGFQDNNTNKGNINPYATTGSLNIARNQLNQNPLAHTLAN